MSEPVVRHFYARIRGSFVHLVQYGQDHGIVRSSHSSPSSSFTSGNQDSLRQQPSSNSSTLHTAPRSSLSPMSSLSGKSTPSKLVIFVPGNPGVLGVYHDFLVTLYKTLSKPSDESNNPVILAISHNNFDHPDHCDFQVDERITIEENELSFVEKAKLDTYHDPHDVELQVVNKLIILKRLLTQDSAQATIGSCKVVFVGHSVGCYVILRVLQDKTLARLNAGSVLIHPALENLAKTEKGAEVGRLFALKLDYLMRLVAYALETVLPKWTRVSVAKWFCSRELVESSSSVVLESIAQMVCSNTLRALIEMAKSELVHVKDLDHETLVKPHAKKLKLIYTVGDHWVNEAGRQQLAELYPELCIEEQRTLHAFVMDPNVVTSYAIKVGAFLRELLDDAD